jgi:hypothetical protein
MRFYFLLGGLLELMDGFDRSSRSRPGYMIQADVGEDTQVGIGLSGSGGQYTRAALARDGMSNFVPALASGRGNIASAKLGP